MTNVCRLDFIEQNVNSRNFCRLNFNDDVVFSILHIHEAVATIIGNGLPPHDCASGGNKDQIEVNRLEAGGAAFVNGEVTKQCVSSRLRSDIAGGRQ